LGSSNWIRAQPPATLHGNSSIARILDSRQSEESGRLMYENPKGNRGQNRFKIRAETTVAREQAELAEEASDPDLRTSLFAKR